MDRRINDLVAYAEALVDLYVQAHHKVEILESLGTRELIDRLGNSYGANAFDALVNVLIEDIIRSTWALALDQAPATPSLLNTWRLAQHPEVLPTLRERFVTGHTSNAAESPLGFGHARSRLQQFAGALGRVRKAVPAITTSRHANRFVTARNKGIAHHEMRRFSGGRAQRFELRSTGITWEGLREYVESLMPVIRDLALIITGTDYRISEVHEHHRTDVVDFWMRIMGNTGIEPVNRPAG